LLDAGHRAIHVPDAGDVAGQGERAPADRAGRRFHRVAVEVQQGHPQAVGGQAGGDGQPDAAGGAGHERGPFRGRHG
jgi:hypothetical protein